MRYWLMRLIYYVRKFIPLYANDNSKIYSAYSAQLLQSLTQPNISETERCQIFLYFSKHFIDDISGERLADSLYKMGDAARWVDTFQQHTAKTSRPRASILLTKTKAVLSEKYKLSFTQDAPLNFTWSEDLENSYSASSVPEGKYPVTLLDYLYGPYRLWRLVFRFKNKAMVGPALQRHFLQRLSATTFSDEAWLKNFERYSAIFKSPRDISIMAEALKLRHLPRDLALLDFTYRVRFKKPKTLLFYRRVRLALADVIDSKIPEYRGTDLTQIFFNPLEIERQKTREVNIERRDAIKEKRKEKQKEQRVKSEKERAKRLAKREKIKQKQKNKTQKLKAQKAKSQAVKLQRPETISRTTQPFLGVTLPLKKRLRAIFTPNGLEAYNPVQLVIKPAGDSETEFQYIPIMPRRLKEDTSLAIISMTGRFDPDLDISHLGNYSRIVVLNSTSMKDSDIIAFFKDYIGDDIIIECVSPSRLLIKPYTPDHQIVSNFSDDLAALLIKGAATHPVAANYSETALEEEYAVSLSDKMYRTIERFYAANMFFETIPLTTPIFLSSKHDNFQFTLARMGFSKIVILGGGTLLGQTRQLAPIYETVSPKRWGGDLKKSFKDIEANISEIIKGAARPKKTDVLIVTHSRSSIHKSSADTIRESLAPYYGTETLDFAPNASPSKGGNTIYAVTHQMDRKLKLGLQAALSPLISETLSKLALRHYDTQDLTSDIASIFARNTGLLLAQTSLFRAVINKYKGTSKKAAILVPGRYAEIRTIAKAFHALGFPTIDVQLLFLSTMARYKAPMATHNAVIDKSAHDFYVNNYNIDKEAVTIIGSIMRDEDIKRAKRISRSTSLKQLGLSDKTSVITLACQPGFETITQEAARILASYIKPHHTVSICIKLHPAQSESQYEALNTIFRQNLPEDMSDKWRVIHNDPFWSLMPATDILVSYFSNVCLQACAFGIPVLSLSGGGPRPNPDFEQLGLARNVDRLDELTSHLDILLAMTKKQRQREAPYRYLQDNPHMADDKALSRLKGYVDSLLQA